MRRLMRRCFLGWRQMNSRPCVGDMAEPPLVLLVLFEGLPSTVVDSAVLDHARQLASVDIARFEIWAFCPTLAIYRNSRNRLEAAKRLAGCPVRLFRAVRPAMLGSVTINARLLKIRVAAIGSCSGSHPRSRGLHDGGVRFSQGNIWDPAIVGLPRQFSGRSRRAPAEVPHCSRY